MIRANVNCPVCKSRLYYDTYTQYHYIKNSEGHLVFTGERQTVYDRLICKYCSYREHKEDG